ncbi:MAG: hypothetical protein MJ169_06155 [Treponema sp.]|nr:hypothetical protein [Treponema sp.]
MAEKYLEPGQLDKTRKNIGNLSNEEAQHMTQVLGGQVLKERPVAFEYDSMPNKKQNRVVYSKPSGQSNASFGGNMNSSSQQQSKPVALESSKKTMKVADLPAITTHANSLIDKLMMSPDYAIKKSYGLFNFIRHFQKDGTEKVIPEFVEINCKNHIEHIQKFTTVMKTMIANSPDSLKAKIANDPDVKFVFLRKVAQWNLRDIKLAYAEFENTKKTILVSDLTAYTRAVYKQVLTIFYLSDAQITQIIKDFYNEITRYPKANVEKFSLMAKQGITEWVYIHQQVINGLYPLLMRMCGTEFYTFPHFFTAEFSAILTFVGLKKFDIMLPEKKPTPEEIAKKKAMEEEAAAKTKKKEDPGEFKNEMVNTGIKILCQLFPQAGWDKLEEMPDLYPYFEPLYELGEPFLYMSPKNPVQVTVVLLKIIEDCLTACSHIKFKPEENPLMTTQRDTITEAINEFPLYREDLFNKKYAEGLKTLVNQTYTQPSFPQTQMGKKVITNIYWQTKYLFIPEFSFDQLLLERPINDNKYITLAVRVSFLFKAFSDLSRQIGIVVPPAGKVNGVENPWEHYKFEVTTPMSKRLDVLLNAKNTTKVTASNANLIKYVTCILAVLNWWVNGKDSPALKTDPRKIYRQDADGAPVFNVTKLTTQDKLFADGIKKAYAAKAAK